MPALMTLTASCLPLHSSPAPGAGPGHGVPLLALLHVSCPLLWPPPDRPCLAVCHRVIWDEIKKKVGAQGLHTHDLLVSIVACMGGCNCW